jgi:hypothetical protein
MVKPELTGQRDLAYSKWHRTLPNYCYMIDLDSVEWRNGRGVVALIETCRGTAVAYKKKFQLRVLKEIALKLQVPCYLVIYHYTDGEIKTFDVYDLLNGEFPNCPRLRMNERQYRNFIQKL